MGKSALNSYRIEKGLPGWCSGCKSFKPADGGRFFGEVWRCADCSPEYERKRREWLKEWRQRNSGKVALYSKTNANRRAQNRTAQKGTLSSAEWQTALDYFGGCCAVCGRAPNPPDVRMSIDHWIPLSKGGKTDRHNAIPLCHGVGGCNNRKGDKMPADWLIHQFGKTQAAEILKRIEDYFAWVKVQE